jgi:hypothetical protein
MAWEVCFPIMKLKKDAEGLKGETSWTCVPIPVLLWRKWDDPGPVEGPWLISNLIKESFVRELQILSTIDQLASGLNGGLKKQVQGLVRQLAKEAGELPSEMELNFGKEHEGRESAYIDKA